MDHVEFAKYESLALQENSWNVWIREARKIAGHSLDGDDVIDGYSLDGAWEAYEARHTPLEYVTATNAVGRPPIDVDV